MKVKNLTFDATCEQIINELKMEVLEQQGRSLFARTKSLSSNMQFSCPFHNNGQEKKPSCGMRRETEVNGNVVIESGTVHCFTCGYTAGLDKFVSDVFGRTDNGKYGNQWLKRHYLGIEEVVREAPNFNFNRRKSGKKEREHKRYNYISENELQRYRYYHDYMFKRGLNESTIETYDVGFDAKENSITFPVRDLDGRTVFINRRGVVGKFHKYGEDDPKTDFVYGMYELYNSDWDGEPVFITESIINCLTLAQNGFYAVSTMGLGGGMQYDILKGCKAKRFIVAYDPDNPGRNATKNMIAQLKDKKLVTALKYPRYMYEQGLDINDVKDNLTFLNN